MMVCSKCSSPSRDGRVLPKAARGQRRRRNPFPSLSSQFSEGRLNGRPNYFEPNFVRTIFIADRFKPNSVVTRASRGLHSQSSVGNRRSQISLPWSPCLRLPWQSGVTGSPPAPCLSDELRHRSNGLFDRSIRVHAMLVVEVDG